MIGAYATVVVVCAGSALVGQAILALAGERRFSWLAAPVGLAALLVIAGVAIKLPGHGTAVAIALVIAAALALALVAWQRAGGFLAALSQGLPAGLIALLGASLPFIAAGRMGILGAGLVNDDMAYHLVIADWLGSHVGQMPSLIDQGYPVGPHALVDGVSSILGSGLVDTFAGLTLALPVLVALVVAGALRDTSAIARAAVGALAALGYLMAAYLAQEAFKEPIEALLLLGLALYLPLARDPRAALPLGVIAAGSVYAYSFPGLFWLIGAAAIYGAWSWLGAGHGSDEPRSVDVRAVRGRMPKQFGGALAGALAALVLLVILIAPEITRLLDFTHFRAFRSSSISGGLGNLRHELSPLEALGVWPTSEFRLAASDSSHPIAFYADGALAVLALLAGAPRWVRRYGWAVPAALAAAIVIYLGALAFGTVYTSAKALAILAPLALVVGLGGLALRGRAVLVSLMAIGFTLAAAASSFVVLRQAPVGPSDHEHELGALRPLVAGHRVLFLGRDDFALYDLRGAKPFIAVRNFYDNNYVRPDVRLADVFQKFDFDSVTPKALARFRYVITTRAAYASGPPPWLRPVRRTPQFVLWKRKGKPDLDRHLLAEGAAPGTVLDCHQHAGRRIAARSGVATVFTKPPVRGETWSPSSTLESTAPGTQTLRLRPGRWAISVQYDATRSLRITAPGFTGQLPGNLDYRGSTPFYPAGVLTVKRAGPVTFTASVERPPLAGRLLGAKSVAHLGAIAATAVPQGGQLPGAGERQVPLGDACGRYVDWYRLGR